MLTVATVQLHQIHLFALHIGIYQFTHTNPSAEAINQLHVYPGKHIFTLKNVEYWLVFHFLHLFLLATYLYFVAQRAMVKGWMLFIV